MRGGGLCVKEGFCDGKIWSLLRGDLSREGSFQRGTIVIEFVIQ